MRRVTQRTVVMIEQGGRGGVTDYTEQLVHALAREGVRVELVTASDHTLGLLPSSVQVLPWFTYFRGGTPWRDRLRRAGVHRVVHGLRFLRMAVRILPRARRAGLVHIQGHDIVLLYLVLVGLVRASGARVVMTPHNTFGRGGEGGGLERLLGRAEALILHTRWDVEQLPQALRGRAHVIPHGDYGPLAARATPVERGPARERLGLPADVTVALCFGQLRADKGIEDVLHAALARPELHVILAGEDNGELARLGPLVAEPGLAGRVHVRAGFQTIDEAALLFAACDVAVLAYRKASMSGVLLLAYGFGRPVVAYPVGGLPEAVLDGETGWLCARADVEALDEALGAVVEAGPQERDRRGEAGRELAATRFAWPVVAGKTARVYAEVAAGPPRIDG